ncbi:MAG TPA: hypothetical protein VNT75_24575 [Symbiobacteriaceae bacterium]|nr:hypothetical protein [Symbiobacteriaceae bacterium]
MSPFTVGTLFLTRDRSQVEAALGETGLPHVMRELNPRWSVFLTQDEWHFLPETQAAARHVSEVAPLLHFSQADDHGWSFRLLHGGRERAAYAEQYPWDPHHDRLIGEDEPLSAPAAPSATDLVYFRLLDLAPEEVDQLSQVLTMPIDCRAEAFKQLLGIGDMESVSYRVDQHQTGV